MAFSTIVSQLYVAAAAAWLIWIVIKTVHSVFFGPLSKFPGSKLAAATRYVTTRHRFAGTEPYYIHQLHLKYGPIVRVGPRELSFIDGQAWKDINSKYSSIANGVKMGQFSRDAKFWGISPPGFENLIEANDADHARMRRNFSHAFSEKALREQEPLIRKYVDQLINIFAHIADNRENQVDLSKYFNLTTFDIMADLTAGDALGCLDNAEYHTFVSKMMVIFRLIRFIEEINHHPWLARTLEWLTPPSFEVEKMIVYNYSKDFVARRLAKEQTRPDILGTVLAGKEEYRLTETEMSGNVRIFMTGGTDSTASLLSGLTYHLLQNPTKLDRLIKEIRGSYGSSSEMNHDNLQKLSYLNACIEEGLRIYPPFAGALPRLVPKGGGFVCGEFIPEDITVYVHQYAAQHSPLNFRNPDDFVPERWLDDPQYVDDKREAAQPFGAGPRNCIGRSLAYHEIRMILADILWHFDLSLSPECKNWDQQKLFTVWQRHPLLVRLKVAGSQTRDQTSTSTQAS